ncbi:MAG: 50S ribosomal protein L25 [Chloroflexi bacterium]|nr:50S ribosomal protein L25 [Chloroflexota bacterium]
MERVRIQAERRNVLGKKVRRLRREGKLPGVLYGAQLKEPIPITMDYRTAHKALRNVGSSTLVEVELEGEVYTTIVRERQRDVISGRWLHIDFQALSLTETVEAEVPIVLENEAPAVKHYGATLVQQLETLTVEALPTNLPEQIVVDLSQLEKAGDTITVADIAQKLGEGVRVLDPMDEVVVAAVAPEGEEEVPEEAPEASEPEVIEKGKKAEDEE